MVSGRPAELCTAKPAKLDSNRTKHFNELIINGFYEEVDARHNGIPPEHIWNFDEKDSDGRRTEEER